MAVPAGVGRVRYIGSGSAGPFPFNFVTYAESHLSVVKQDVLGVVTTLVLDTDYTVNLAADFQTATVTLTTPLAGDGIDDGDSEILTITRDPPVQQLTQWPRNDPFPSITHERAADLAVMMIGRLNEKISRSLLLPETSVISGLTLPPPSPLEFLRWNMAGTGLENALAADLSPYIVTPFIETLLNDADAATARATLGALASSVVSAFALTLLDDANADTFLNTLINAATLRTWAPGDTMLVQSLAGGTGGKVAASRVATGKQTIWVPASAMKPRTIGPSVGSFSVSSTQFDYLAFDPNTAEDATFNIAMPKSWDHTVGISMIAYWLHPATVTNFGVAWEAFARPYSDDDAIDGSSYTTIGLVADTGGTTNDLYISPETAVTVISGAAQNDLLNFIIRRSTANGGDTMTVDAHLIGVKILYSTNANTDV